MVSIKNRIKLALHILFEKEDNICIDKVIEGYEVWDTIKEDVVCDNFWPPRTGCDNDANSCLSRTHLKIEVTHDDHVHVCESCSKELLGKKHEFR